MSSDPRTGSRAPAYVAGALYAGSGAFAGLWAAGASAPVVAGFVLGLILVTMVCIKFMATPSMDRRAWVVPLSAAVVAVVIVIVGILIRHNR